MVTVTETAPTAKGVSTRLDAGETISPVRSKRSWVWAAGAIALIIAGGLGSVVIFSANSHTQEVFVVNGEIHRGDVIGKTDLGTLDIAEGQKTQGIPVSQASDVIGEVATVDLPKGSLVTSSAIASGLSVPEGKALVGLSLKPAQLPAQQLVAGDEVQIVAVAANATGQGNSDSSSAISGTVSDTATDQSSGTTVVDVYVNATVAADLTSRAAAGAVAIYVVPVKG